MKKAWKYPLSILKIYGIIFLVILGYILVYALIDPQSGMVTPWIMIVFIWFVVGVGWIPVGIGFLIGFYQDKKADQNKHNHQ